MHDHSLPPFFEKSAEDGDLCVNPWAKGLLLPLPPPLFHHVSLAGACSICGPLHATKLRPQMGRDQGRLILYLQINTLTPMVHPAAVRWFHGFSSRYFPQTGFPLQLSAACALQPAERVKQC